METRFNFRGTVLVISDSTIPDPRPSYGHGCRGPDEVAVQLFQRPLTNQEDGIPEHVVNLSLRTSEARTIASALMTAAQSVR